MPRPSQRFTARLAAALRREGREDAEAIAELAARVHAEGRARRPAVNGVGAFTTTRLGRFESRTRANAWAAKQEPDKRRRLVLRCDFAPGDCPSKEPITIDERRPDR